MCRNIFVLWLLVISHASLAAELIVWNVGQGQWVSEVHADVCLHFDMGGEKNPLRFVRKKCSGKLNLIHISHWDWDHISFLQSFHRPDLPTCLVPSAYIPEKRLTPSKQFAICDSQQLKVFERFALVLHRPGKMKNSNDSSEVVSSKIFKVLLTGDSTKKQEKIWGPTVPRRTGGLILGHHGSQTSTSQELLRHLPRLRWAVASARKSRYGHPHPQVEKLLKKEKVPLLRTEDWGHLHFQINETQKYYER